MIKSMTGFGRGEYSDGKRTIIAEIKSVNHRYSDFTIKMPRRYSFAEDALKIKTEGRRGTIVCNPPYGERLSTVKEAEQLYRAMGRHFATLDSWQIYVLTSDDYFERLYGRRADAVRRLYNGMIRCNYYQFFKNRH